MGKFGSVVLGNVVRGAFTALRAAQRKEFLEINSNAVAAMLVRIFQYEDAPVTDRFLVMSVTYGPYGSAYVQSRRRSDGAEDKGGVRGRG